MNNSSHDHRFDNLHDMGQFLEIQLQLIQEETDNLNRPLFINKIIQSITNKLPKRKDPVTNEFTDELYQIFKKEIISIF